MRRLCVLAIAVTIAGASAAGCRTTEDAGADAQALALAVEPTAEPTVEPVMEPVMELAHDTTEVPPRRAECPVPDAVCSTEIDPVICTAELPGDDRLVAWGSNHCSGKLALARAACAQGLVPSRLDRAQCVPDASNGNCPVEPPFCTMEFAPTRCVAGAYGEQDLTAAQALVASGSNPCNAQAKLAESACRRNLDPKRLSKVSCESEK